MKFTGTLACDYGTLYHVLTDYSIQVDNACRDVECCYLTVQQLCDEIDKAICYCDAIYRTVVNSHNLCDTSSMKTLTGDYIRHFKRLKQYYLDMEEHF